MKIYNKIISAAVLVVSLFATACSDIDDVKTRLTYNRNFAPTSFEASVVENVKASFTWATNMTPDKYIIELYTGSEIDEATLVSILEADNTYGTEENPFITEELLPEQEYTARIKAVGTGKDDSKWTLLAESFTTKKKSEPKPETVEKTASLEFVAGEAVAASYTLGCATININNGNSKFAIDGNTQYFGDATAQKKYTARLKSGGASGETNGVSLVTTSAGTLVIAMRSSSSSAERTVTVSKDGVAVQTFTVGDANADKNVTIEGEESAKTVFHTYTLSIVPGTYEFAYDGGLNFYGFDLTYQAPADGDEPTPTGTEGNLNFGDAAATVSDGQAFTFGSASITVNNGNSKFAIDTNTQYFGDATAQTKYVTRMKSGGASGETNGVTLTLDFKGTVTIAMRSSSSSADRKVELLDAASSTAVASWTVGDANADKNVTIVGEESAKTVFHTYSVELEAGTYSFTYDGGVNFYGLTYKP